MAGSNLKTRLKGNYYSEINQIFPQFNHKVVTKYGNAFIGRNRFINHDIYE